MQVKYFLVFVFCYLLHLSASGQPTVTISGVIKQRSSFETINGATITYLKNGQNVISNDHGFYSIRVRKGDSCTLVVSHVAHDRSILLFFADTDTFVTLTMTPLEGLLSEVKVQNTTSTIRSTSSINLPIEKIQRVPSFLGEKDILKVVQLLPGVQSGNEGSTGFYVRGGGADQNLILLDGITVYNVSHLFGFFSLFPPEAVKSVELIKGGFPAQYGGRLSSVLDIKLKEGNQKTYGGSYSIGLLSSKVSLEGPLKKDKASFILTARRTYFDALLKPFTAGRANGGGYYFYDGVAKMNYAINPKNRLFLSVYNGKDQFYSTVKDQYERSGKSISNTTKTSFGWGNITGALRWNQILSKKVHLNHAIHFTQFRYQLLFEGAQATNEGTATTNQDFIYTYASAIKDLSFKSEGDWYLSNQYRFKYGITYTRHAFSPSTSSAKRTDNNNANFSEQSGRKIRPESLQFFAAADLTPWQHIHLNLGLHNSLYKVDNSVFTSLQPRLSGLVRLSELSHFKLGYTKMLQPIHLLTNNGPGLPTDLWVPATQSVPPQKATQYSLGFVTNPAKDVEVSVETYYKKMKGIIEYIEGANFLNTTLDWEDKVEKGKGESYGAELFIQKKAGRLSGWTGYTLSWSNRTFLELNGGKTFFYKYDHRHDFKTVLIYTIKSNIHLSFNFVMNSGNRITLPNTFYNGRPGAFPYSFPDFLFNVNHPQLIYHSTWRNDQKMKTYHRADLSMDFLKTKKRGTRVWNISIYNLYARQNPYFYYYKQKRDGTMVLTQVSIFPIIPSLSYTYKWN